MTVVRCAANLPHTHGASMRNQRGRQARVKATSREAAVEDITQTRAAIEA